MGGCRLEDASLSYASLQRSRVQGCQAVAEEIKERWECTDDASVLHWDGKKMQELVSKYSKEERLPILISGS